MQLAPTRSRVFISLGSQSARRSAISMWTVTCWHVVEMAALNCSIVYSSTIEGLEAKVALSVGPEVFLDPAGFRHHGCTRN